MVTKKIMTSDDGPRIAKKTELKSEPELSEVQQAKNAKRIQLTPEMANNLFNNEKKRYESILKERSKIENMLLDTEKTEFALKEISESKSDELFVNLGGGVYVAGKVQDAKKVKFQVGTEVFLEKTTEDVLKTLAHRKDKLVKDLTTLQKLEAQTQQNLNSLYTFLMNNAKKKQTSIPHNHNSEDENSLS